MKRIASSCVALMSVLSFDACSDTGGATRRNGACGDYYDLKVTGSAGLLIGTLYSVFFECGVEDKVTLSP